jgi:hypothetical protein
LLHLVDSHPVGNRGVAVLDACGEHKAVHAASLLVFVTRARAEFLFGQTKTIWQPDDKMPLIGEAFDCHQATTGPETDPGVADV